MNRYYSKQNRKLLRAAPAATARSMKNKLQVQKLIDEQAPRLTIYETEFVEEENTVDGNEIDILQLKTRDYNRKLQEEKENVNLWLEFVDFQDEVFRDQVEKAENGKNISHGFIYEVLRYVITVMIKTKDSGKLYLKTHPIRDTELLYTLFTAKHWVPMNITMR